MSESWSIRDAAETLGISRETIRRAISLGELRAHKGFGQGGTQWRVIPSEVRAWLLERLEGVEAPPAVEVESIQEVPEVRLEEVQGGEAVSASPVGQIEEPLQPDSDQVEEVLAQGAVPLSAHLQALTLVQTALERAQRAETESVELRRRAEQAERQKLALEMELRGYQLALEEQAGSLAEARAAALEIEAQKNLKVSMPKPGFGQRLKRFLWGGQKEETG